MLLLVATLVLGTAVFLVGEALAHPARQRTALVRRAAAYGRTRVAAKIDTRRFRERAVAPALGSLAQWTLRLNPRMKVDDVHRRLLAAGLARVLSPTTFLALKAALAGGGGVLGVVFGTLLAGGAGGFFFAFAFGFVGFAAPDVLLTMKARSRRETIRAQLPDALDLLTVSVEAGLGFDGAVAKLIEHMNGPIVEEFELALNEMRIGESRQEALKRLTERVDAPEVSAFTRAIIQSDQLGISLGRILRVQAADSRLRRQAAAEERAMKAPIKMLFPTVLFIFPAMFLVILGPAFLNLMKLF